MAIIFSWARERVGFLFIRARVWKRCVLRRGNFSPFPVATHGKNLGSIKVSELIRNYKNIFYWIHMLPSTFSERLY